MASYRRAILASTLILAFSCAAYAQSADSGAAAPQEESLADIAKRIRANKKPEVLITEDDAQTLFKEVDSILSFASESSELPKRGPVKYKLVGREEVDRHFAEGRANDDAVKKIQRSELVLKKFGLLAPDFHIQQYLNARGGGDLAGFYDFRDKTMYLLNWIALDKQRPVMAHELTHALQDQNFDLMKWRNQSGSAKIDDKNGDNRGMETQARVAATEGQAMLVYLDYDLSRAGVRLIDSTSRFEVLKSQLLSVYDQPVVFHSGPLIFSESAKFPYYDGFSFELELLKQSGKQGAFSGVYARPPRDTHEIIHPEEYIAGARKPAFALPNLMPALGTGYKFYDSGAIGELDTRIMAKQFGRANDAYSVSPNWNGAAYLAVRKPAAASKADADLTPSDIALLYVSRWKTAAAAERFVQLYKSALTSRSGIFDAASAKGVSCSSQTPDCTSRWYAHFTADGESIAMEISSDNTVLITQGLDDSVVQQVKLALARPSRDGSATDEAELSMKLMDLPPVRAMREEILEHLKAKIENLRLEAE